MRTPVRWLFSLGLIGTLTIPGYPFGFNVERITFNSTQDWFSTLAVDDSSKVHIIYRHIDEVSGDAEVYYISDRSGTWIYEAVTANGLVDYPGEIAVTPAGSPHLTYTANSETEVYYAKKEGPIWVLDPVTGNSNYKVPGGIALGPDSTPNIAYFQLSPGGPFIYYAAFVSDTWQIQPIPNSDTASPFDPSLAMDSNHRAHLAFGGNRDVYYATNETGVWETTNITNDPAVDGRSCLALDRSDFVHVVMAKDDEIYYGNNRGGAFQFEQVTTNGVIDAMPSLYVDATGNAHIVSLQTPAVGDINYHTNAPGYWMQVPVYQGAVNKTLWQRNIAVDRNGYVHITFCAGGSPSTEEVYHAVTDSAVGIEELQDAGCKMRDARLMQNYPNPFSRSTTIRYQVSADGRPRTADDLSTYQPVNLSVYDLSGRFICTLLHLPSSHRTIQVSNRVVWDGMDSEGREVQSGIYFYRLSANGVSSTKKLTILR